MADTNSADFNFQFGTAFGDIKDKAQSAKSTGGSFIQVADALTNLQDQINTMRRKLSGIFVDTANAGIQPGTITTADFAPGYTPIQNVNSLPALPNPNYPIGIVVFLTTNGHLYRNVANAWTDTIDSSQIATPLTTANFSSTIRPVQIVTVLPTLPNAAFPNGSMVLLTTDGLVYTNPAGVWKKLVTAVDLSGQITTTQISPNSITSPLIAANAVLATNIAAGAITAGKLAANSVIAGTIAVGAVNASDITTGTLTVGVKITALGGSGIVTDISQVVDPTFGAFSGIQFRSTLTNQRLGINQGGLWIIDQTNSIMGQIGSLTSPTSSTFIQLARAAGGLTAAGQVTLNSQLLQFNQGSLKAAIGTASAGTSFGQMQLNNSSGTQRVLASVDAGSDTGYVQLNSNYVPVVSAFKQKIAYGANQLSSGQVTINTGLSSIVTFVATIGTAGGTPTEFVASSGVSGGSITVNSSNVTSSLFVAWIAIGLI